MESLVEDFALESMPQLMIKARVFWQQTRQNPLQIIFDEDHPCCI
jgi:hypothetical protein